MKLIIGTETDPYYNLAREEILLDQEEEYTVLWQNRPSVILGRNQNTLQEIDETYCKDEQIHVVRRITGGGAVYHDMGNINYSFFFRCSQNRPFEEQMKSCQKLLLEVLRESGVPAVCSGRNDICVEQGRELKKVSGCAMLQRKNRGLFHGTLLYDADLEQMKKALTPSRLKLQSKGIASVGGRVANLKQITGAGEVFQDISCVQYMNRMAKELQGKTNAEPFSDTRFEENIRYLAESKYRRWSWNYGKNPACALRREARFPAGIFQIGLEIKGGMIVSCRLQGDYFHTKAVQQMEVGLQGVRYEEQAVSEQLEKLPWKECFEIADKELVLNFLFERKEL